MLPISDDNADRENIPHHKLYIDRDPILLYSYSTRNGVPISISPTVMQLFLQR